MALSVVTSLLVLELGVRIVAAFDTNYFDEIVARQAPTPGRELTLADLIRPSADDLIVYGLRPGAQGRFLGQPVAINSLGMRDGERALERRPGPSASSASVIPTCSVGACGETRPFLRCWKSAWLSTLRAGASKPGTWPCPATTACRRSRRLRRRRRRSGPTWSSSIGWATTWISRTSSRSGPRFTACGDRFCSS